jgi:hypothetical protein
VCDGHGIEHRPTKPDHPWTNGQVERMARTLNEAAVERYRYGTHPRMRKTQSFVDSQSDNFESVPRHVESDEDKARFEGAPGKVATATVPDEKLNTPAPRKKRA